MFHLFPLENSVRSRKENSLFISIIIFSLEGEELFLMCWFQIKVFCLTCLSQVLLSQRNLNPLGIHLKFSLPMACNHTARTCLARLQTDFVYHLQLGYCDWFKILGWPWLKLLHRNCISIRGMHFIQWIVTYKSFARIACLQFLTILLDPVIQVADQTTG